MKLRLNSNLLTMSEYSLPPQVFDNLNKLSVLTLYDNTWNDSEPGDYRSDLFKGLKSLQRLALDGIPSCKFGVGFSLLKELKNLEIFGRLTVIKNETFENFVGLPIERLNIKTDCNLTALQPEGFSYFHNLTTLDLGYNRAIDLDKVSDAWYGLRNTTIRRLILTRIIPQNVQTTNINAIFYRYLKETRIENLQLDRNNIVITEPGISEHLPFLLHLDMSYNRLSNVGSLIADFANMKHLVNLDASNQIRRYDGVSTRGNDVESTGEDDGISKRSVRAADNPDEELVVRRHLRNTVEGSRAVTPCLQGSKVDLCPRFKKTNGSYPLAERGPWCFILPPKLESFNLSSSLNVELLYMPEMVVLGGSHMKEMLYRSNGIQYASGPILISNPNPKTLISADFSENGLSCISVDLFKWTVIKGGRMDKLFLSSNNLAAQMAEDATGEVFKYYPNLTELHLDKNSMKSLPSEVFSHVLNLVMLNLSGNSLRLLEFNFDDMRSLRILDISDNLITNIFSDTLVKLNAMIERSNLSLNLLGNPIQCSCDSLDFLRWILKTQHHLIAFSQYACIYGNKLNNSVTFDNLAEIILPDLSFRCSTKTALQVAGGLLALFIVIVSISVAAYRLRWDIHVCFLRFRTSRKDFVEYVEIQRPYKFDAFIIYDKDDQRWVQEELEVNLCPALFDRGGASNNDHEGVSNNPQEGVSNNDQEGVSNNDQEGVSFNDQEGVSNNDQEGVSNTASNILRLCIHGKHFTPGEPIIQNIMVAIQTSRKIVVILSSNFLGSNWCDYELELSNLECVSRGFNIIVPILLEEFEATSTMSVKLRYILRNQTYLQWPNNRSGKEKFWEQLRGVLRTKVKASNVD